MTTSYSALQILQSFNNTALQALSTSALQMAVDLASSEVSSAAYGTGNLRNKAIANLAAHNLLSEDATSSSNNGGQQVVEKQIGKRRIKYSGATRTSQGNLDPNSDEGLQNTIYGQRFMRIRNSVAVGMMTSGSDFD